MKKKKVIKVPYSINIKQIEEEYKPMETNDVFIDHTKELTTLKNIIYKYLTPTERRVLLLYTETQSQIKVGEILGVSVAYVCNYIKDVRKKIKGIINELNVDTQPYRTQRRKQYECFIKQDKRTKRTA